MKLYDFEMRNAIINNLNKKNDNYIIEEFNTPNGKARADIITINSNVTGYEIKSDHDSISRLKSQVYEYDIYFEYNYIIVGEKYINNISKIIPNHWGIIYVYNNYKNEIIVNYKRRATLNPFFNLEKFFYILSRPYLNRIAKNNSKICARLSKTEINKLLKQDLVELLIKYTNKSEIYKTKKLLKDNLKLQYFEYNTNNSTNFGST